ncbi:MAG: helix-hairpin-helix domain-containing protein [Acidimicrobiia bacterium]
MSDTLPSPLDNKAVARTLLEIADLLELKGDNPFKIRAYRNAADVVSHAAEAVSSLDEVGLRGWNGIGKDLAGRIREITLTGDCEIRRELLTEFPATLLDVMRLHGVGPKTVAVLYRELGVRSLEDLATAARSGKVRGIKGMGSKKEQLILQAIEERQRFAGRHLLSRATDMAEAIVARLKEQSPTADLTTVGSVRRGTETSGDLDIVATGDGSEAFAQALIAQFTGFPLVERVLANGSTMASVLLRWGFQAHLMVDKTE